MRLQNRILEYVRHGVSLARLDDDTIERVVGGGLAKLYKCEDCGVIFEEENSALVRTDMEAFYGVSSLFPDTHYENLTGCPSCFSVELEDLGTFSLEDFDDYEEFKMTEGTQWRHIAGPKQKYMDQGYQQAIMKKLNKLLSAYDIDMINKPIINKPHAQTYIGYDTDNNQIQIIFSSRHIDKMDYREGKNDMLVQIRYKDKLETAGVVDLSNKDNLDAAFQIITMTLENMGFKLEGQEDKKEENKLDPEIENLRNFRDSLSESELIEIFKEEK